MFCEPKTALKNYLYKNKKTKKTHYLLLLVLDSPEAALNPRNE